MVMRLAALLVGPDMGSREHQQVGDMSPEIMASFRAVVAAILAGMPLTEALAAHCPDEITVDRVRRGVTNLDRNPLWCLTKGLAVRLKAAHWYHNVLSSLATERGGDTPMVETRTGIDRAEFLDKYYYRNRAVYLPRSVAGWPAVTRWNRQYLRRVCGEATVEVMVDRDAARSELQNTAAHLRREIRWPDYVDSVFAGPASNDRYLVSRNYLFDNPSMAVLLDDFGLVPFVETRLTGRAVRLWLGPSGTMTPWHHDDRNNVIFQLVGRKQVNLCPPFHGEYAYQVGMWYAGADATVVTEPPRTLQTFATRLMLDPGDALFIPAGWWHAVEALEPSATLACVEFGVPNCYDRSPWFGLVGL